VLRHRKCFFEDDYQALLDRMLAADGMVWGSPNYSFAVKAQMKA
jgi:multimeric flavodoxin WrbA